MSWPHQQTVPPGWYPDPSPATDERYWDGWSWTGYVRSAPSPEPALTPLPARAFATGIVGMVVGAGVALVVSLAFYLATGSTPIAILASEIGLWSVFLATCVLVSQHLGTGDLGADYGLDFRPVDLIYGVASFFACLIVAGMVASLFLGTRLHGTNTGILSSTKHDVVALVVVGAIATVGAPIFEELFFRGLIRRSLETKVGPVAAVWLQAGLFSIAHFQVGLGLGNVSVIAGTVALGVVLGYTARITGRLVPGMIAHAMFNGLITLTILIAH